MTNMRTILTLLLCSSSQAFIDVAPKPNVAASATTLPTSTTSISLKVSSKTSAPYSDASVSSLSSSSKSFYTVQRVQGGEDDSRVIDIATFRNDMINPQAMVERAQEKRDNLDTTKVAIDGLKVGLFQVGPAIALASFFTAPDTMTRDAAMMEAATNYGKKNYRHLYSNTLIRSTVGLPCIGSFCTIQNI
jgi:hypothetical protein